MSGLYMLGVVSRSRSPLPAPKPTPTPEKGLAAPKKDLVVDPPAPKKELAGPKKDPIPGKDTKSPGDKRANRAASKQTAVEAAEKGVISGNAAVKKGQAAITRGQKLLASKNKKAQEAGKVAIAKGQKAVTAGQAALKHSKKISDTASTIVLGLMETNLGGDDDFVGDDEFVGDHAKYSPQVMSDALKQIIAEGYALNVAADDAGKEAEDAGGDYQEGRDAVFAQASADKAAGYATSAATAATNAHADAGRVATAMLSNPAAQQFATAANAADTAAGAAATRANTAATAAQAAVDSGAFTNVDRNTTAAQTADKEANRAASDAKDAANKAEALAPSTTGGAISPQQTQLSPGQAPAALQFTVNGQLPSGPVTWASSNPQVASVDASGNVSALQQLGTATITARQGGVSATAQVMVIAAQQAPFDGGGYGGGGGGGGGDDGGGEGEYDDEGDGEIGRASCRERV